MKKIMLKECKSYTFRQADGTAVPFIKGKITECSDHVYKQAMQTGKFIDVSEGGAETSTNIEALNKAQLQELTEKSGIDISLCKTKAEMITAIESSKTSEENTDSNGAEADFGE